MISILTRGWYFMQIIRLALGSIAIFEYLSIHEPLLLFLGCVFLVQGIFNLGCSGERVRTIVLAEVKKKVSSYC